METFSKGKINNWEHEHNLTAELNINRNFEGSYKTVKKSKLNKPFSSIALSTRDGANPIPMNDDLKLVPEELATSS